jgi:hypothetical protein
MSRKKPQGLWIHSLRQRRTANMFADFAAGSANLNLIGGIAIAVSEGSDQPLVAMEGRLAGSRHEAAGVLLHAALSLYVDGL